MVSFFKKMSLLKEIMKMHETVFSKQKMNISKSKT